MRFQNKLPSSATSRPVTVRKYPVIRIISHSNYSKPTASPIYIKSYTTTTTTERNTFAPSANEFQVTENVPHSKTTIVKSEINKQNNKGNTEVLYPITVIKPSDPINQIPTNFVTPQSSFSSYSPSHESVVSGPNPGDDFPIISLIDEPSVNYYEQVFQNTGPAKTSSQSYPFSSIYKENSNPYKDSSNPYYAPEEFTYNQDPILIDHGDPNEDVFKEITQSVYDEVESVDYATQFTITKDSLRDQVANGREKANKIKDSKEATTTTVRPTTTTVRPTTTLSTIFLEQPESKQLKDNAPRSIDFKSISSHHNKSRKSKEFTNLVNTIEYKPTDTLYFNISFNIKPRNKQKDKVKLYMNTAVI